MKRIMVIDDERNICQSLQFALEDRYEVYTYSDPEEALLILGDVDIHVVLLDLKLGPYDGIHILQEIKQICPKAIVIIMTAYGSMASSLNALKHGAFFYVAKPIQLDELDLLLEKALEFQHLSNRVEWMNEELERTSHFGMIGKSEKMQEVFKMIEKVKDIDSSIMITGESGTGKEVVARAIHYQGKRKNDRFLAINCAAIPPQLLESELFGYEKGAFTGAVQKKAGLFQLADGGTLFLDEVGEMDPLLQSKVLRVVQEKRFTPVGGTVELSCDVRIISATNRDLRKEVDEKRFRQDLYYRLTVIPVSLPPLRERTDDIPALVEYFIQNIGSRMGNQVTGISQEALQSMLEYSFPGNVRELQNIIERAIALTNSTIIQQCDLVFERETSLSKKIISTRRLVPVYVGESLDVVEKKLIEANLEWTGGNRKRTADLLGMSDRSLRDKIKKYELEC